MIVGVLAFQGDFAEHIQMLHSLKVPAIEVRSLEDLAEVDALIIPGGESTVMAKFLKETGVGEEIVQRARAEKAGMAGKANEFKERGRSALSQGSARRALSVYGTCAGAILLASKATGKNAPKTLGLIDITVDRNAYGTQLQSFETELKVSGIQGTLPVVFIRAPKITKVGKGVEILSRFRGTPVLVRQGNVIAGTFHSEVRESALIHKLFLKLTKQ